MIDLNFQPTVKLSTQELPYFGLGVTPVTFEFNIRTSFEFNTQLAAWTADNGADQFKAKELLLELLVSVENEAGESAQIKTMGDLDQIQEQTGLEFLINLLKSWIIWNAAEREQLKKSPTISYSPSNSTADRKIPVK